MALVVYPAAERLEVYSLHEIPEFVEDRTKMPTGLSWTNGVRLVLDTPIGKVRRDDLSAAIPAL